MNDMQPNEKFVEFDKYCKKCTNFKTTPTADPCNECLSVPARLGTRVPLKFKEDKKNGR